MIETMSSLIERLLQKALNLRLRYFFLLPASTSFGKPQLG
jgi:hypothetical protein